MWVIILKSPKGRRVQSTNSTLPNFICSRAAIIFLMLYSCSLTKCLTFCDPHELQMPGFLVLHYLSQFAQTPVHWVSDAIQLSHLLLTLLLMPSIFPRIRVFSNESALHTKWPKYWRFSFSISLSNEYSVLISFRIDWFDLLAVQGTLKNLQHHSSKASNLWCSAFFMIQLSHPHMTVVKSIALTIWTFVSRCLCFLICCIMRHNFYSKEQVSFSFSRYFFLWIWLYA